ARFKLSFAWVHRSGASSSSVSFFFFSSRRRHTRWPRDWSSDVCSSDLDALSEAMPTVQAFAAAARRAGVRLEEGVGVERLIVEHGHVVAVSRSDGRREPCDVAIVAGGTWDPPLLAPHGVRLPLTTRALPMLLTE